MARRALGCAVGMLVAAAGCAAADTEAAPTTTAGATTTAIAVAGSTTPATVSTTTAPPKAPELPPPSAPLATDDPRVFVLGDSVVLGAQRDVVAALPGRQVTVDAVESRLVDQGLVALRARKAQADEDAAEAYETARALAELSGQPVPEAPEPITYGELLGPVAVISLCTNYSAGNGFGTYVRQYMDELSSVDRVVFVTCGEWSPGQIEANEAVRAAGALPGPSGTANRLIVADWAPHGAWKPYTYDDGIHVNELGRPVLGEVVARAVGPIA